MHTHTQEAGDGLATVCPGKTAIEMIASLCMVCLMKAVTITVGMVTTGLWDRLASDCSGEISGSQSSGFKMSDQAESENQFP